MQVAKLVNDQVVLLTEYFKEGDSRRCSKESSVQLSSITPHACAPLSYKQKNIKKKKKSLHALASQQG